MAFKMKSSPYKKSSALKGLVRSPFSPHNDAHKSLGDNSEEAHGNPDWQKHYESSSHYKPPEEKEKEKPLTGKMVCESCGTPKGQDHPYRHPTNWIDSSKYKPR